MSTSSYLTQNLRYLMQEKGLTANQIGQGGGSSQPTISRILKGNSANQSSIEALASFFAVPMEAMNHVRILGRVVTAMSDM